MRLTEKRAKLIDALRPESRYLLTRDSSQLAPNVRTVLHGTNVIELVDGREERIQTAHLNAAKEMIEGGFLVEVESRPFFGRLYRLTDKGRAIDTSAIASRPGSQPRMMLSMLEAIAAKFDCKVRFIRGNARWELNHTAGKKIKYNVLHAPDGTPAVRLTDMSPNQWRESIKKCLELNGIEVPDYEV